MGSLMSGWDSPVKDPKTVKRNLSLTKDEIEEYWRLKKKTEEEHLQAISCLLDNNNNNTQENDKAEELVEVETETSFENQNKTNGWWTRSNWAFLNEPPAAESRKNNYVSQFHIANLPELHAK